MGAGEQARKHTLDFDRPEAALLPALRPVILKPLFICTHSRPDEPTPHNALYKDLQLRFLHERRRAVVDLDAYVQIQAA